MPPAPSSNWPLVRRMLALAWRYRWGCLLLVALQTAILGLGLAGLTIMGLAVDTIGYHAGGSHSPPDWPLGIAPPEAWTAQTVAAALAAAMLLVALVRAVLNYSHAVAIAWLTQERIVVDLRAAVYAKLQRLSSRFFASNTTGSLINRVTGDAQSVRTFVDGVLVQMVIVALSLAVYLAYMLRIHPGLTAACLATTPLLWVLGAMFSKVVRPAYQRNRELFDRMLLTLSENVRGVQAVKAFERQPEETEKFRRANREVRDQQRWIFWRVSVFTPTIEAIMSLNVAVLLGYGGYLVICDELPLGAGLIVFLGLLQQFAGQVSKITNIVNSVQQALVGAQRVFEVLDAPVEIHSPANPRRLRRARGRIEFDRAAFGYQPDRPVLREITLRIEPGQRVALLGATGEGKTTLLSLVPRFLDAIAGRVLVDGVDVRRLDLDDLRRNVGMVFQENFLFSDTVAANIAFGRPDATREEIRRAARVAAADDFIRALPDGYDTVLREGGRDLSGGQRQRLAIARAVLREPPILLLDDATSAIDPGTEEEILAAMERAMAGRTTLLVAHRLGTLQRADFVVVLKAGRIVEVGPHEELMARRGPYCRAAVLQTQ